MKYKIIAECTVKTRLTDKEMQQLIALCKRHGVEKVKRVCMELMNKNRKVTVKELKRLLESKH